MRPHPVLMCSALLYLAAGCGHREEPKIAEPVQVDIEARRPAMHLSDYRLFTDLATLTPNEGVFDYEVKNSHYLDGADLEYFAYIPTGKPLTYTEDGPLDLPVGSVLSQTLSFPQSDGSSQRVETRLLIHQTKGWVAVPYLWDENLTDATRSVIGEKTQVVTDSNEFTYLTPDMNQCKRCHKSGDTVQPIGFTAANLNLDIETQSGPKNQIQDWIEQDLISNTPTDPASGPALVAWNDPESGSIEERARAWLDINCANCHNPDGEAIVSGLDLSLSQHEAPKYGVYKPPVAAGRGSGGFRFSIEPGKPDLSFLVYRLRSTDPGVMMPPLGRSTIDEAGARLIEDWIAQIEVDSDLMERALNPMEAYRPALEGGNAAKGREIFYDKFKCVACHTAEKEGEGLVGPNLSDVGSRTEKEYLLESLVVPSATVVEGFETVLITTSDEEMISGTLLSEDGNDVVLADSTGATFSLKKSDIIDQRISNLSGMPSVANLLTVEEVGDLIAYLTSLNPPTH